MNSQFTFQYASIKPEKTKEFTSSVDAFTFQYASIKPFLVWVTPFFLYHLHFNMLLLNPYPFDLISMIGLAFTFQYASIKPNTAMLYLSEYRKFTFQYASIKPATIICGKFATSEFTFQYASIKPCT